MVKILNILERWISQLSPEWLICENSHQFFHLAEKLYLQLLEFKQKENSPKILLAEREPVNFIAGSIAAFAAKCPIFICNPDWQTQEWQQVFKLVQPDIIWGQDIQEKLKLIEPQISRYKISKSKISESKISESKISTDNQFSIPNSQYSPIMIPTGGSSGKIKFAIHTWETLAASARGFQQYFQLKQVNSVCVLPLHHVSGLMQFIRCFTTNGKLVVLPFKQLENYQLDNHQLESYQQESFPIYNIDTSSFFISLVPTQLQRLLQKSDFNKWLSQFKTVLLGGGPAWDELLSKARYYNIPIALTYGMTETASQIATLRPEDFFQGKLGCGQILPHAKVHISNQQNYKLNSDKIGNINIDAQSLFLGYYPQIKDKRESLKVDDLGFLDDNGYLHVIGRNSDKIITGGENVYPYEIESAIRATGMVRDVCVIGITDKIWGQAVTAIYVAKTVDISIAELKNQLQVKISKFKIPKHWISVSSLPRNSQGKINRQKLQEIAINELNYSSIPHK